MNQDDQFATVHGCGIVSAFMALLMLATLGGYYLGTLTADELRADRIAFREAMESALTDEEIDRLVEEAKKEMK